MIERLGDDKEEETRLETEKEVHLVHLEVLRLVVLILLLLAV